MRTFGLQVPAFFHFLLVFSLQVSLSVQLRCVKCLSLECPHDHVTCKNIEERVAAYSAQYFDPYDPPLPRCPPTDPSQITTWRLLESDPDCLCQKNKIQQCSATRFQVDLAEPKTVKGQVQMTKTARAPSFGTILGCSSTERRNLFRNEIKDPSKYSSSCHITNHPFNLVQDDPQGQISTPYNLTLEHCQTSCPDCDTCYEDFCINREVTIPMQFKLNHGDTMPWVIIGSVIGACVIIITVYLAAELWVTGRLYYAPLKNNYPEIELTI